MSIRYMEGYEAAFEEIQLGKNPQHLFRQSEADIDFDDFTRGWQKACLEYGAVDPS